MNSVQQVMQHLEEIAKTNDVVPPQEYVRCATLISLMLQVEQDEYYLMEQEVAKQRASIVESGKTAAYAKIVVEASDAYRKCREKKSFIETALEIIKIAKTHAKVTGDMARSGMA